MPGGCFCRFDFLAAVAVAVPLSVSLAVLTVSRCSCFAYFTRGRRRLFFFSFTAHSVFPIVAHFTLLRSLLSLWSLLHLVRTVFLSRIHLCTIPSHRSLFPLVVVSVSKITHTHTHTHTYIHIQPKYFTPFWSPTFSLHFTRSYRTKRREHRSRTTPNHNRRVPRVGPTFRFMETRSFEPNILSFGRVLEVPCVCCVYCVGAILVTFGLTVSIE